MNGPRPGPVRQRQHFGAYFREFLALSMLAQSVKNPQEPALGTPAWSAGHRIGPGRKTWYTYHKTIGYGRGSKYTPALCRARGCR